MAPDGTPHTESFTQRERRRSSIVTASHNNATGFWNELSRGMTPVGNWFNLLALLIKANLFGDIDAAYDADILAFQMGFGDYDKGATKDSAVRDALFADYNARTPEERARAADMAVQALSAHVPNERLLKIMESDDPADEEKKKLIMYTMEKANELGRSPGLALNWLFVGENPGFDTDIKNHKDAIGLAQITPETARTHGINPDDLTDPYKSIDAFFKVSGHYMEKYNGDKVLAMIAYNAGPGDVEEMAKNVGKELEDFTGADAVAYMETLEARRQKRLSELERKAAGKPEGSPEQQELAQFIEDGKGKWSTETLPYIRKIQETGSPEHYARVRETFTAPPPPDDGQLVLTNPLGLDAIQSSEYGWRRHPVHGGVSFHKGNDYSVSVGTDLRSPANGVVVSTSPEKGYGQRVIVHYGHGVYMQFAHLSKVTARPGDAVHAAEKIGETGNSGTSTGPHLDLVCIIEKDGKGYLVDAEKIWGKDLTDPKVRNTAIAESGSRLAATHRAVITKSDYKHGGKGDLTAAFKTAGEPEDTAALDADAKRAGFKDNDPEIVADAGKPAAEKPEAERSLPSTS